MIAGTVYVTRWDWTVAIQEKLLIEEAFGLFPTGFGQLALCYRYLEGLLGLSFPSDHSLAQMGFFLRLLFYTQHTNGNSMFDLINQIL